MLVIIVKSQIMVFLMMKRKQVAHEGRIKNSLQLLGIEKIWKYDVRSMYCMLVIVLMN